METAFDARMETSHTEATVRSRASDWLWRPWHAKLWWAAIPAWWVGMVASTKVAPLEAFYDSALAGFLNVLFFPMTALLVLGVGYARNWLTDFAPVRGGIPLSDDSALVAVLEDDHLRAMEEVSATTDMHDPRSGTLYVGNPISPNNGARISVF